MAGIVLEDRAAGAAATKLLCHGKILHAELDVCRRFIEAFGRTGVTQTASSRELDLHQTDFTGLTANVWLEIAFVTNNRMGQRRRYAVSCRITIDDCGITFATLSGL